MPRVQLPDGSDGDWFKCHFVASANTWRSWQRRTTPEREEATKLVLEAAVCEVEAAWVSNALDQGEPYFKSM